MKSLIGALFGGLLLAFTAAVIVVMAVFAASFLGAIFVYFIWNYLIPIYFTGILPAQFLHLSFFHCWLFLLLNGLIFGARASTKSTK